MQTFKFDKERINSFSQKQDSNEDLLYINELFSSKDHEAELEQFMRKQWYELFQEDIGETKNLNHILYRIHYAINMNSVKSTINRRSNLGIIAKWFSRIAVVLVIPLAIYFVFSVNSKFKTKLNENLAWVEIKAPASTRAQFSLPDGTKGWLSSNSSIRYNINFNNERHVKLSGEAFFDVVKNVRKPFEVDVDGLNVLVLGTKFNIASYDNENIIEVVLEEGKLVCYNKMQTQSYNLKPNDYLLFDKTKEQCEIQNVQAVKYTSWKEGKLIFRNDPIDVIARRLERWYNIEVEVKGELPIDGLWATFVDENFEEVLKILKLSFPIKYKITNPQLSSEGILSKTKVTITSNKTIL